MGAQAQFKLIEEEKKMATTVKTEQLYRGFKKRPTLVGDGFKLADTLD